MATEKVTDTHQPAPADQAALDDIQKQLDAGGDPFGDNDTADAGTTNEGDGTQTGEQTQTEQTQHAGDTTTTTEQEGADKGQPTAEQLEEAARTGQEQQPAELPKFKAELPENFEEQRKTLRKEKSEAFKKYNDGEITDDAYAEIVDRVDTELENLTALRIRTETLQEVNAQTAQASQQAVIANIINTAKKNDGLDYQTNATAAKQFDIALSMAAQDPDNAGKSYAELAGMAHLSVLALRGLKPSAATQQQTKTGDRQPKDKPPVTLAGVPSAATANSGGDVTEQLGSLRGQAYEEAFANLPPAQRARMLDE